MKSRCDNPKNPAFKYYGGRGISYDVSWESFDQFLVDMGERPTGTSLDRIDSNGPYNKGNCRWVDSLTQAQNTRNRRFSEEQIRDIRRRHSAGESIRELSKTFGACRTTIGSIVHMRRWKNV